MNIYSRKQIWKLLLLITAVVIGLASLWYTSNLVEELKKEEERKMRLWSEATSMLTQNTGDVSFLFSVISNNKTIPVLLIDEDDKIVSHNNLDSAKVNGEKSEEYLQKVLFEMKAENRFIKIPLVNGKFNYIYYQDSHILTRLNYYPFFQLGVISIFIIISYVAFSASRKAEQNQVWVGMAKETAHQLGTPLSSLLAWLEYLKLKDVDENTLGEIKKDLNRLEIITERFSKIGAKPYLENRNVKDVVSNFMSYLRNRLSKKVEIIIEGGEIFAPINIPLFEWVIENISKNAVDAMNGEGTLTVNIHDNTQYIYIDIKDTGKGIPSSKFKAVFKPGYTSKKRGWGLGLSLTKRIIEEYHKGKIFVKESTQGKGTTFRIVLNKQK